MRKADNLPTSCAVVTKSGNLKFLEPSGSVQARNGPALPLPLLGFKVLLLQSPLTWVLNFAKEPQSKFTITKGTRVSYN